LFGFPRTTIIVVLGKHAVSLSGLGNGFYGGSASRGRAGVGGLSPRGCGVRVGIGVVLRHTSVLL